MKIEIVRLEKQREVPQRGVLLLDGSPFCVTLELPWRKNAQRISCIPEGSYTCDVTYDRQTAGGLKIPKTFEVKDVPNRHGVLFHIGNTTNDTHGCILLAAKFGVLGGRPAILESREAFNRFIFTLENKDSFSLDISWAWAI